MYESYFLTLKLINTSFIIWELKYMKAKASIENQDFIPLRLKTL